MLDKKGSINIFENKCSLSSESRKREICQDLKNRHKRGVSLMINESTECFRSACCILDTGHHPWALVAPPVISE